MGPPFSPGWAAATVLLLGRLVALGDTGDGKDGSLQVQVVNFDFETVRVTWNASAHAGANLTFLYQFSSHEPPYAPCSHYVLHGGRTAGCLLTAPGDTSLHFALLHGARLVLNSSFWISDFLKPSSPRALSFLWHRDAVTVTCPDLPYGGLLYEVQHKSTFDSQWQSKEEETCNVTVDRLDADKCYLLRARVRAMESSYGSDAYPSDWSEVVHLQGAELRDSCPETTLFPKFILVSSTVGLLTVFLVSLFLWKLQRVKALLVPSVPDPKSAFPRLFEAHQGSFQEWIKDTQDVTPLDKAQDREEEFVLGHALRVQRPKAEAETPTATMTGPVSLHMGDKEVTGDPSPPPKGEELVSLGGFTFTLSDNSYVTL